jgi:hypothetical protein
MADSSQPSGGLEGVEHERDLEGVAFEAPVEDR